MLPGKVSLPLCNEPSHDYVGDYLWTGRPMVFGRRPIFIPKIENFTRTKCYLFSIIYTSVKFQASRFNNKKIAKSVHPLNPLVPEFFLSLLFET